MTEAKTYCPKTQQEWDLYCEDTDRAWRGWLAHAKGVPLSDYMCADMTRGWNIRARCRNRIQHYASPHLETNTRFTHLGMKMTEARSLFDQSVLPLFEATRADWLEEARAAALSLGLGGRSITINDVRRVCPPPPDVDPRVMGAVFLRTIWVKTGYENSGRNRCHGRPIAIFKLRTG